MKKKKSNIVGLLVLTIMLVSYLGLTYAEGDEEWGYEGDVGPDNWGELNPNWAECGEGRAQSPIDIANATTIDLSDIQVNYGEAPLRIFNNGHTIEVKVDEGYAITYNEIDYNLLQFHFHHPSEHLIDGEAAAMELHFVHASDNGNLAVIGVLIQEGEANDNYASIFDNLPNEVSEAPDTATLSIDLESLLPVDSQFTTYNGSLTTPPCSEIVRWLVMNDPITLSAEQIDAFAAIYAANARPAQPLNDRDLLSDNG